MCGIVSYIGDKEAEAILLQGLKSIEYRGYDSSGLALLNENEEIEINKSVGKIADLEKLLENKKTQVDQKISTCGIGHTRWATHGEPNETNAHPHHLDNKIALVHNGIIRNYQQLKQELESEGVNFNSETDTEVIVQLFAKNKKLNQDDELKALRETVKQLDGSYAIALLAHDKSAKSKRKILVAKNESPLVIGVGKGENFVASDSSTVLQFTDKVLRLKDKELAEVTEDTVRVEDLEGKEVRPEIQQLAKTSSILEKGPYKHFLLKEIHEQPAVISRMLRADNEFEDLFSKIGSNFKRIVIIACGSAYYAGLVGKNLIERWAGVPVEATVASEYIDHPALVDKDDLVIGISQSGETADTLAAIRNAKQAGAKVCAITNKADSAIVEICENKVYVTPAGIEVSVASTKAFTAQVMAFYLFALKLASKKESLSKEEIKNIQNELNCMPQLLDQVIERAEQYQDQLTKFEEYRDFLFLSRGINYPIALEGALKLKELSYIHATGYASGEMKHGPIAILDHTVPVLSIAISGETELEKNIYHKVLHNAEEARARKSPSIVIACDDNKDVDPIFETIIRIPNVSQLYSPIIAVIPLQFLAYCIANELGKDVDQPRNLAKSVTVE